MLMVYKADVVRWQRKLNSYFLELFHSLFSLDDDLNIAQSMIIYFKFMSDTMMSMIIIASIIDPKLFPKKIPWPTLLLALELFHHSWNFSFNKPFHFDENGIWKAMQKRVNNKCLYVGEDWWYIFRQECRWKLLMVDGYLDI